MNIFISTWALLVGGLVATLPMIYLRVKDHTEEHEEISTILYVSASKYGHGLIADASAVLTWTRPTPLLEHLQKRRCQPDFIDCAPLCCCLESCTHHHNDAERSLRNEHT